MSTKKPAAKTATPAPNFIGALATDIPDNANRRSMSPVVRLGDIPVGTTISGRITGVIDSPTSTYKGKLIQLKHDQSGQEFSLQCSGPIRSALAPGKEEKELQAALEKEIGKVVYAKRLADKPTQGDNPRNQFVFDVFTTNK